jgi:hypothetical protein
MLSYDRFCFLQHIRSLAFPYVNSRAIFPLAEGSLRDVLVEACYFFAQNLPTIVTLLPCAGLTLALLLSFFSPESLPGGLSLSDVDQSIAAMERSLTRTRELCQRCQRCFDCQCRLGGLEDLVLLLNWCIVFLCFL